MSVTGLVNDRTLEALQDLAAEILMAYENGQKAKARDVFRMIPDHRKGYIAFAMMMNYATADANPRELEAFFESVTA
jgi:hypothetical protein